MKPTKLFAVLSIMLCLSFILTACATPATATPQPVVEATALPVVAATAAPATVEPTAAPVVETAPAAGETITVIFPKHEADIKGAFEARIREFEKESGIKVELIQSDWDSVANRVVPELATKGSAYDVVEFDNGWVAEWCGAGWVTPLNDYMDAGYTDGMIPGLVNLFSCPDGKLYGVVWNNDTRFFHYNAAKLQEAGFSEPPKTWDEFTTQSLAAQKKGVVKYGMAPFWNQEWSLGNEFHFWTYAFGGELVDEKGCFKFNTDPNTLKAVQYMMDSLKNGVSDPAGLTYNQAAAQDLFLKGDTLFFPQAIAGLMSYTKDPTLSKVDGQVKVGLVPTVEGGKSAALTLPEAYAIPTNSKHKDAAWKFIKYMTSKETNKKLAQEIGVLPIWVDLYSDADLTTIYPFWKDFQAQLTTARGLSKLTWYSDFVDISTAELHKALSGGQTAQEALDNMASQLSKYKCVP
jgi:multiple sugar transport system substrate-binding protein